MLFWAYIIEDLNVIKSTLYQQELQILERNIVQALVQERVEIFELTHGT